VREGCRHPDGWSAKSKAALEGETSGHPEDSVRKKRQAPEATVMHVSFNIPGPLRGFTANRSAVQLELKEGADLLKALLDLFRAYPGLRDRILTESGELRHHVNIFVENENVRYMSGLTTPLPVGAEVSIVPAISGG
jgi:molybdopterin converting factor small subunit